MVSATQTLWIQIYCSESYNHLVTLKCSFKSDIVNQGTVNNQNHVTFISNILYFISASNTLFSIDLSPFLQSNPLTKDKKAVVEGEDKFTKLVENVETICTHSNRLLVVTTTNTIYFLDNPAIQTTVGEDKELCTHIASSYRGHICALYNSDKDTRRYVLLHLRNLKVMGQTEDVKHSANTSVVRRLLTSTTRKDGYSIGIFWALCRYWFLDVGLFTGKHIFLMREEFKIPGGDVKLSICVLEKYLVAIVGETKGYYTKIRLTF